MTQFVAHPNCQQHLTSIWYGAEMGFMQSLSLWKKIVMWIVCVPLVPIFCIIYLVSPETKVISHVHQDNLRLIIIIIVVVVAIIIVFFTTTIRPYPPPSP